MRIERLKIKIHMATNGLTVKNVAEKIGMKPQNLCNVLNRGTCSLVTAGRIAKALGLPVSEIMKEE